MPAGRRSPRNLFRVAGNHPMHASVRALPALRADDRAPGRGVPLRGPVLRSRPERPRSAGSRPAARQDGTSGHRPDAFLRAARRLRMGPLAVPERRFAASSSWRVSAGGRDRGVRLRGLQAPTRRALARGGEAEAGLWRPVLADLPQATLVSSDSGARWRPVGIPDGKRGRRAERCPARALERPLKGATPWTLRGREFRARPVRPDGIIAAAPGPALSGASPGPEAGCQLAWKRQDAVRLLGTCARRR